MPAVHGQRKGMHFLTQHFQAAPLQGFTCCSLALCPRPGFNELHNLVIRAHMRGHAQVNSVVLDGSVSKDGRMNHWTSEHKRIIFATPQAFKNDVFKGKTITCASPQRHLCLRVSW